MLHKEKDPAVSDSSDEAAAAKMWAVYISEAEKYDKGLVESWKSDMDGLLIFAALFSAILTAFIIESYKSLDADPANTAVQILGQISQQLAASANGTKFNPGPSVPFTPGWASLVCNGLWFLSLGFSLTCALVATLVQQWARDFLHKTDIRSAPVIRARIFSYLYYGLKRFRMHTVVEIMPILLHTSLFLFFVGLVAFLSPVNIILAAIAAAILGAVVSVYSVFTILPLWYRDCPYHTPLSSAFWTVSKILAHILSFSHSLSVANPESPPTDIAMDSTASDDTMVEAMTRAALQVSSDRSQRDQKALVWTLKSLSDDTELEPFVEAIPDLLWSPNGRRPTYEGHILHLVHHPEVYLNTRIATLLDSCDSGLLRTSDAQRRRITCYKALWAIATLAKPTVRTLARDLDGAALMALSTTHLALFGRPGVGETIWMPIQPLNESTAPVVTLHPNLKLEASDPATPYYLSALAVMACSTLIAVRARMLAIQERLATYRVELSNRRTPDMSDLFPICSWLRSLELRTLRPFPQSILFNPIAEIPKLVEKNHRFPSFRSPIGHPIHLS
ncbi:hypothetical protein MSAN_00953500 [Mycena sanguinolenta]|uniref:DUF6535 domain-containing protein n=1 Tax=Mycena sanguinolenta TaxID=230812 RepID=A0A8H6YTL7_9AGAR|nr:hypothetical protein MSAN_00953500 [Mycena sanguinolenta]